MVYETFDVPELKLERCLGAHGKSSILDLHYSCGISAMLCVKPIVLFHHIHFHVNGEQTVWYGVNT